MADSMALWFDPNATTPKKSSATAEIHLNLWRHTRVFTQERQFLDVGIKLTDTQDVAGLHFYVPVAVEEKDIEDLSDKLRQQPLLNAVFNDVVDLGPVQQPQFFDVMKNQAHYLTIHALGQGLSLRPVVGADGPGTIIGFPPALCTRLQSGGPHYLRFRIKLSQEEAKRFSYHRPGSSPLVSVDAISVEFTELRFNEFRNLPAEIAKILGGNVRLFTITAAHCFLLRDMSFELVASHSGVHKMRRLEAHLWEGYLPAEVKPRLKNMLVYHWKSIAPNNGDVESFVALAKFRRINDNLLLYMVGIVLLGSLGSAFAAWLYGGFNDGSWLGSNLTAGVTIVVCLGLLYLLLKLGSIRAMSWSPQKGKTKWLDP